MNITLSQLMFMRLHFLFKMFNDKLEFEGTKPVRSHQQFLMKISTGKRPKRQPNIPDCYWELIQECWKQEPEERPTFEEITKILRDDKFAINEFGIPTNLDELHEYWDRIDPPDDNEDIS